jgi:hypothetical protein
MQVEELEGFEEEGVHTDLGGGLELDLLQQFAFESG